MIIHRLHHFPRRRRLGRHIAHDPRSRDFPAKQAKAIKSVVHKAYGLPLDQGEIGSCTANAATGALLSDPYYATAGVVVTGEANGVGSSVASATELENYAKLLYHEETALHPEYGVYPPEDPGGSGLWVAKVLKNRGLIKSYQHAFGIEHALRALVLRPCIFGIDWYSSFDNVDVATGLVEIAPRSRVDGGHEIVADEIDAPNKLVWFWQSWGKWGYQNSGRFCMTFDTLDRLLQNQGDCTQFTPIPRKVAK